MDEVTLMKPMSLSEISSMAKKPIRIKPSRRGLLHKKLGVPIGKKIPPEKIAKAKNSASPALRKEATFEKNAVNWHHD